MSFGTGSIWGDSHKFGADVEIPASAADATYKRTAGGDLHPLEVVEVNAERLVLGAEGIDIHSLADIGDRKSTRLNSSHITRSRMPSSA